MNIMACTTKEQRCMAGWVGCLFSARGCFLGWERKGPLVPNSLLVYDPIARSTMKDQQAAGTSQSGWSTHCLPGCLFGGDHLLMVQYADQSMRCQKVKDTWHEASQGRRTQQVGGPPDVCLGSPFWAHHRLRHEGAEGKGTWQVGRATTFCQGVFLVLIVLSTQSHDA